MTNRAIHVCLAGFVLAGVGPVASNARAAEMQARLQRNRIYLGTQTLLEVRVQDPPDRTWPTVEPTGGLRIRPQRTPSLFQDMFRGTTQYVYQFLVTPEKAGTFRIPGVSLKDGAATLRQGPFTLEVVEAPLTFYTAKVEPAQVVLGENAQLVIAFQGVRPGKEFQVPSIVGVSVRPTGSTRVEVTDREGMPVTIQNFTVTAHQLGTHSIAGITFDGVPADPVTLTVAPYVILDTRVENDSLAVGQQTMVHIIARGLPQDADVKPVVPAAVKWTPARQRFTRRAGESVFSFEITPTEPGSIRISEITLADGGKAALPRPIVLNVRQGGQYGILSCRGIPRTAESVVGEPFFVDYEVFFRGDLQAVQIDPTQAGFADKEHIRVEPVDGVNYAGWQGIPYQVQYGRLGRITVLSGSGEFNGQKEQLLRFALRITPLAAGELPLDGLRVIVLLQVKEERRTAFSSFFSSRTEQFDRLAETPSHKVIDPPGMAAPPLYRGAVGSFTFTTELDRTSAAAMSPLTLTMKIAGDGVSPRLHPPPLTEVPELTRDFDVSPTVGGGEVKNNVITFTQVIRPRSETVKALPALPLVAYDYRQKKYVTVHSLPIPIKVVPGSLVGADAMEVAAANPAVVAPGGPATAPAEETVSLGANYDSLGVVVSVAPMGANAVLALLVGGPAGILLVWGGRRLTLWWRPKAAARQQRRALLASLDQLGPGDEFFTRLAELVQAALRLEFGLPPGELTADVLARALDARRVDGAVRREIEELLSVCDAGRFAAAGVSIEQRDRLTTQARSVLARVAGEARA